MPFLPRRLRRPKAELTIDASVQTPPEIPSGGVVRIRITLLPRESFTIRRGWAELSLVTTRFSRTVLDGYHEHSSEALCRTVELCGHTKAQPGIESSFSAELNLSCEGPQDTRPSRLQWVARVRFENYGYREIRGAKDLRTLGLPGSGGPVVDGTGFLPLYEFSTDETSSRTQAKP